MKARHAALLAAALALLPGLAPGAAPADPYQAALDRAGAEGEAGRYEEAAGVLSAAAAEWPQDFQLRLAQAYYLLRAGRYEDAADRYRAALELSPDSAEAHRGLEDARARRGAPTQWWLGLHGAGTGWSGHPARTSLGAGVASLDGVAWDRWSLGATYRALAAPAQATAAGRGRGGGSVGEVSHEGQAVVGFAGDGWGLSLHGAAVSRSAVPSAGQELVFGYGGAGAALAASLELGLAWRGAAAWIGWEDRPAVQLEATAALPLGHHLELQAGWRGQRLDGALSGAALAGVAWRGPWSVALRAEHGWQRRPWDLAGRALYGLPEPLLGALRLEAGLPVAGPVRAWLGADLERWRVDGAGDATAARLGAGLLLSL